MRAVATDRVLHAQAAQAQRHARQEAASARSEHKQTAPGAASLGFQFLC